MADVEHREILGQGVEAWNDWRKEHPDEIPMLQRAELGAKLQGANLQGANLAEANLAEANLQGGDLAGANLVHANLAGANLVHAKLQGANLQGAHLAGANILAAKLGSANLKFATLRDANLQGANLQGANLENTDLQGANLQGAKLRATNVMGAALGFTSFGRLDLLGFVDLSVVAQSNRSLVDTVTLEATAASLSKYPSRRGEVETFLRRVGVPESLITDWFALLVAHPIEFYSCFISYSHEDKLFARRLYNDLQARGIRCWLDEHKVLPGDDIYDAVDQGIRLWDKVLLCCSEYSLTSWWVDDEIRKAFAKERKLQKERAERVLSIVPLNLDGYLLESWRDGKAQVIRDRLAADFEGWEQDAQKYETQFEKVVEALQTARPEPPEQKL